MSRRDRRLLAACNRFAELTAGLGDLPPTALREALLLVLDGRAEGRTAIAVREGMEQVKQELQLRDGEDKAVLAQALLRVMTRCLEEDDT